MATPAAPSMPTWMFSTNFMMLVVTCDASFPSGWSNCAKKGSSPFCTPNAFSTENITARKGTSESNVEYVKPIAWRFNTSPRYRALATTVAWEITVLILVRFVLIELKQTARKRPGRIPQRHHPAEQLHERHKIRK